MRAPCRPFWHALLPGCPQLPLLWRMHRDARLQAAHSWTQQQFHAVLHCKCCWVRPQWLTTRGRSLGVMMRVGNHRCRPEVAIICVRPPTVRYMRYIIYSRNRAREWALASWAAVSCLDFGYLSKASAMHASRRRAPCDACCACCAQGV